MSVTRRSERRQGAKEDGAAKAAASPAAQLASFLGKFTPEIATLARKSIALLRKRLPGATVLVYDNYNALAVGFGPNERTSEAILSIAVWPRWVSLFFLQGKGLADPQKILKGSGNRVRHVVLTSTADLDQPAIRALIAAALARSQAKVPARGGEIVIKSISAKQRPRRPA
jgi:hypothetical protein